MATFTVRGEARGPSHVGQMVDESESAQECRGHDGGNKRMRRNPSSFLLLSGGEMEDELGKDLVMLLTGGGDLEGGDFVASATMLGCDVGSQNMYAMPSLETMLSCDLMDGMDEGQDVQNGGVGVAAPAGGDTNVNSNNTIKMQTVPHYNDCSSYVPIKDIGSEKNVLLAMGQKDSSSSDNSTSAHQSVEGSVEMDAQMFRWACVAGYLRSMINSTYSSRHVSSGVPYISSKAIDACLKGQLVGDAEALEQCFRNSSAGLTPLPTSEDLPATD
eukprot:jgi/Picsp_1/52/NSC_00052-R1_---NA---